MNLLLGLDLGSTSIKAILYDLEGNVVAKGTRLMRRFHPNPEHPEWTVWDPTELWNETASACREALAQIADPGDVKGIATTGMGMDGLPMSETGKPLYPLISWHDSRTQPQFDWWMRTITAEKTYSIGGNPVWAINSALRMLWIKENEPEIYRNTFKWLLIEDYINHCLTGAFATDFSMASCTMLFDQRTQTWSDELCRLADLPKSILPDVFVSSTLIGQINEEAAKRTGLRQGTPVFLGGHDHLCSAIPVGAFRPGVVMSITGTWETVGLISETPPLDLPLGRSGITTQSFILPKRYMIWGGNPSGEMIEWYRREIAIPLLKHENMVPLNWDVMIEHAKSAKPCSGGILFLPHLDGSQCPYVDPRSRGVFAGISTRTTHAEMIRSIFEGLGYQIMDVIAMMEQGTNHKGTEVVAVGGAIRNKFWMQNKADMLGRTVRVPEIDEATVLGVAILAGIGAGLYRDAEEAFEHVKRESLVYEPDETLTKQYAEVFPIYRQLYAATAPINHALFDQFAN
jgi:xylulokinase